jgi:hypothetical protein
MNRTRCLIDLGVNASERPQGGKVEADQYRHWKTAFAKDRFTVTLLTPGWALYHGVYIRDWMTPY